MSSKGGSTALKRMALPKARHIQKKTFTWAIRPSPGAHSGESVLPLGSILRDVLELAANAKEARHILQNSVVSVNARRRKSMSFPVGLFDVVTIEGMQNSHRLVFDTKGRLIPVEIDAKETGFSVQKVLHKTTAPQKKFQLTTNAGFSFVEADAKVSRGASLQIDLKSGKITSVFEMKPGNTAYIIGGTHVGTVAQIEKIMQPTMKKPALVELKNHESFQTLERNVFVVGTKSAVITVLPKQDKK